MLTDVYKDVSYVLDEDAYATSEYTDVVRKRFVKAWENIIEGYKARSEHVASRLISTNCMQDTFTETNFRLFFGLALDVLLRPWEKIVFGLKYSEVRGH